MNEKKLIPKLRFPDYSDEWTPYELGDFLTFFSTKLSPEKRLKYKSNNVKIIFYEHIYSEFNTFLSLGGNGIIPPENHSENLSTDEQYLRVGDLLICNNTFYNVEKFIEVGNIKDEKLIAGSDIIVGRDETNVTVNGFKVYLFSTNAIKSEIENLKYGFAFTRIKGHMLSKINTSIPSKNEQKDIVNFISCIDKKIHLLEQKHEAYLNFKCYLMQELFTRELRFDSVGDWEITKLGDITKINTHEEEVKFKDGRRAPSPYKFKKHKLIDSYSFDGDAILIISDNDMGKNYYHIQGSFGYHQRIDKIGDFKSNIHGKYVYYYLEKKFLMPHMNADKTIINSLRQDLSKIEIEVPTLEEQIKISNTLSIADKKINLIENEINMMKTFKEGLLQQMFI